MGSIFFKEHTQVVVVQLLNHIQPFLTPRTATCQASSSFTAFLELAQTQVLWVNDAIKPSPPLLSPSPPAFNPSQHQGLFRLDSTYHLVAKVLELQHESFQWIYRVDFLWDWLVWSPCHPRDSQSFPAPQFEGINSSVLSLPYCSTFWWEKAVNVTRNVFYITFTDNISMRDHTQWILTLNKYS